jgi:molybdopterin molybdotransferase
MIALEVAQARLLALAHPVSSETCALSDLIGRCLAQDVVAARTQPTRDLSAMDGYAVHAAIGKGPWTVIGESSAGAPFASLVGKHQAVRIFTGAVMPDGTDAVIMQEDIIREESSIALCNQIRIYAKKNVRLAGSDFAKHDVLARAGQRITPAHIGLFALAACKPAIVRRRIKVALVSTGDELVTPGTPCDETHIPASNAAMLAALLAHEPVDVADLGTVPDDLAALTTSFARAGDADVLVTIGGASVGDHDLVRPALLAAGASIDFWQVAMRPGKPVLAGKLGDQIVLGLPGNPVSAYVTALVLLKPLIAALAGDQAPLPTYHLARLGGTLPANGNRTDHIRARLDAAVATPLHTQDSAGLQALARANALIIRRPGAPSALPGEEVFVLCA